MSREEKFLLLINERRVKFAVKSFVNSKLRKDSQLSNKVVSRLATFQQRMSERNQTRRMLSRTDYLEIVARDVRIRKVFDKESNTI